MAATLSLAALALVGCSSGSHASTSPGAGGAGSQATSPPPITTATPPAGGTGGSGGATTASNGGAAPAACTAQHLALQIGGSAPGNNSGVTYLILRNAGTSACTVRGYPGVSFVDQISHPVGPAVGRAPGAQADLVLAPTQVANAELRTTARGCSKSAPHANLVRVYPPDQKDALTTALDLDLCGAATVGVLMPGAGGGPSGYAAPAPDPVSAQNCSSAHLALTVGTTQGAAGTEITDLDLRNAGTAACHLEGFPGVSLLDANFRTIGRPADHRSGSKPPTPITLQPGQVAHAELYSGVGACNGDAPEAAYAQVYPPGERGPLLNAIATPACRVSVDALAPGTSAGA